MGCGKLFIQWKIKKECLDLITYYLKNDEVREKIARNGQKYVSENYTWKHSVEKILKIISNNE